MYDGGSSPSVLDGNSVATYYAMATTFWDVQPLDGDGRRARFIARQALGRKGRDCGRKIVVTHMRRHDIRAFYFIPILDQFHFPFKIEIHSSLRRKRIMLPILTTSRIRFFKPLRECTFWTCDWKGDPVKTKMLCAYFKTRFTWKKREIAIRNNACGRCKNKWTTLSSGGFSTEPRPFFYFTPAVLKYFVPLYPTILQVIN